MSSSSLLKKLSYLAANMVAVTSLQAAQPTATHASETAKVPAKTASADRHAAARQYLLDTYAPLNLDFEGDFPAFYWDYGKNPENGHVAAPGGVSMAGKADTVSVIQITSLSGRPIPIKSYSSKIQEYMTQMADERVVPEIYKGDFEVNTVELNLGTLNRSNVPDRKDRTSEHMGTNVVYYVPRLLRHSYQKQARLAHLEIAENLDADWFYKLPLARQIVLLDMIYPMGKNIKNTKFYDAVKAANWKGKNAKEPTLTNCEVAMREAWASSDERGKFDPKTREPSGIPPRRYAARRLLLQYGDENLTLDELKALNRTISDNLPPGETILAGYVKDILYKQAKINEQNKTKVPFNKRGSDGLAK